MSTLLTPQGEPPKPKAKPSRMLTYALLTIPLMAFVVYIRPDQLAVLAKLAGKGTFAAWAAYWTDKAFFANFIPTFSRTQPRDMVTAFCVLRRPVIFLGWAMIMSSLG